MAVGKNDAAVFASEKEAEEAAHALLARWPSEGQLIKIEKCEGGFRVIVSGLAFYLEPFHLRLIGRWKIGGISQ
jgi:hypothetical protein